MIPACGPALLMLIVIATDTLWPALADPNEALANAVAGAFTPAQISELIAAAAGKVRCSLGNLPLAFGAAEGPVVVLVRPEQIRLVPLGSAPSLRARA